MYRKLEETIRKNKLSAGKDRANDVISEFANAQGREGTSPTRQHSSYSTSGY